VQLGEHSGVGTLAFIVAETAIQEIARVTIIMILRIVVVLLWVLTAGQCWLTFRSLGAYSAQLAKIVKKYPIWNACHAFFNEGDSPVL
jgi:hypothetical protein